jgi:hypothetical protein
MTSNTLPLGLTFDDGTVVRGPSPRPESRTDARVHVITDHEDGGAYAETQTNDAIRDGDVLLVPGVAVGVMVSAWPILVAGESGIFDSLAPDADITALGAYPWGRLFPASPFFPEGEYIAPRGGADYTESFELARTIAAGIR